MSGELWRGTLNIGLESTPGTPVAATRRLYTTDPKLSIERPVRQHRFATQTRDNIRRLTHGPRMTGGNLSLPISSDEILEWLLMGVQGGVTPTGATAKIWTFQASGPDLDSATLEWHDGSNEWQETGCLVNQLRIAGSVREMTNLTVDLFGLDLVANPITTGLDERIPRVIEGWETRLYIDPIGDTPGTTNIPGTLLNWDISINNQLGRKYTADNTLAQNKTTVGELVIDAKLTFEAATADAVDQFDEWEADNQKVMRVLFGGNELISGSDFHQVAVDMAGGWTAVNLGGSGDGTRTYEFSATYVFDPAMGAGLQIICVNDRSSAWI